MCGNEQRVNASEYTLSLPYFICQEWGNQCVAACNDNLCQSNCRQNHPCGAQDPKRANKTLSTASASASASSTGGPDVIYTGTPGSGSSGSGSASKGTGAALEVGRAYGVVMVMSGLFAGFALL